MMDTCTYCRREYPGMRTWYKKGVKIRVCESSECRLKAFLAGFDSLSEIDHAPIP